MNGISVRDAIGSDRSRRGVLRGAAGALAWQVAGCGARGGAPAPGPPLRFRAGVPASPLPTAPVPGAEGAPVIGLFADAARARVPDAATVRTAGWSAAGRGAAVYVADAEFPAALHPRAAFRTADGRVFRLADGQVLTPEMFGAAGDLALDAAGRVARGTNDTAAFAAAGRWIEAAGGGTLHCRPGGRYLVGEQRRRAPALPGGEPFAWAGQPIFRVAGAAGHVAFEGHGALLKAAPGYRYGTFDPGTGEPKATPSGYAASAAETGFPWFGMIDLQRCRGGFTVREVVLDGSGDTLVLGGQQGDLGRQVNGCGLYTLDNEGPVMVEDVEAHHQPWDGWLLRHRGPVGPPGGTAPTVLRFNGHHNGRQALSLTGGIGGRVVESRFERSGEGVGLASAPAAGLDVEPEGGAPVRGWRFERCRFGGTSGVALLAAVGEAADLAFRECEVHGAREIALWPGKAGMVFTDCLVTGMVTGVHPDTAFHRCRFTDDAALSPFGRVHLVAGAVMVNLANAARAVVDACTVERRSPGIALYCDQGDARFVSCTVRAAGGGENVVWGRWFGTSAITAPAGSLNTAFTHPAPGARVLVNGRPL